MAQLHAGFLRGSAGFLPVARPAGADHIFPCVLAAAEPRYDMVKRELPRLATAILADVPIAGKDLGAGQLTRYTEWTLYEVRKADDRWDGEFPVRCVHEPGAVFQHFGFALVNEHDGAPDVADIERFVVLVQDEYRAVYHAEHIHLDFSIF